MLVTAMMCRAGAFLYRHTSQDISVVYFFATAAATLIFVIGVLWMLDIKAWKTAAPPLVMFVPIPVSGVLVP